MPKEKHKFMESDIWSLIQDDNSFYYHELLCLYSYVLPRMDWILPTNNKVEYAPWAPSGSSDKEDLKEIMALWSILMERFLCFILVQWLT